MKDNEIEILINGEKTDIFDAMDYIYLKPGEYIYKDNDKWYVKKNKSIVLEEDKKIRKIKVDYSPDIEEKIFYDDGDKPNHCILGDAGTELIIDKINEIIDVINKGDSNV